MRRRAPNEVVERLRRRKLKAEFEPLRRRLARWCRDHADAIAVSDPAVPSFLDDRERDNWHPLLAIADAAGGPWPELARRAAEIAAGSREEDAPGLTLLADLRDLFHDRAADRLATDDILGELRELDERPWSGWRDVQPLNARGLAKLLKPFGIEPRTVKWPGGATAKGYVREWFDDAFARYLPPNPSPASPPASIADGVPVSEASRVEAVTEPRIGFDPRQSRLVTEVTDSEPGVEGIDDYDRRGAALLNALSAAEAEWDPATGPVPFPGEREHVETCTLLGVRASDPSTWSREYLQGLGQDRALRIARQASGRVDHGVESATPPSPDQRDEGAAGLVRPVRLQQQASADGELSVAPASPASLPGREADKREGGRG
jgi:hypothetical protein